MLLEGGLRSQIETILARARSDGVPATAATVGGYLGRTAGVLASAGHDATAEGVAACVYDDEECWSDFLRYLRSEVDHA